MALTPPSGRVIVEIAWMAVVLLPALIILGEFFFGTDRGDSSADVENRRRAGLVLVRTAWAAAILVPLLIILGVVFSRGDGGGSSRQSPQVAASPPTAPPAGGQTQRTKTRAAPRSRTQPAAVDTAAGSRPSSGASLPSSPQPGETGARTPVVNPQPKPSPAPEPKPAPAPPQTPPPSQPPVSQTPSAPVQTTTVAVANNNVGP